MISVTLVKMPLSGVCCQKKIPDGGMRESCLPAHRSPGSARPVDPGSSHCSNR